MMQIDELTSWDVKYIELAKFVASWSKDPDTKVGSVLVSKFNSVISLGFNGIPRGIKDTPERLERPNKYDWIAHSESNLLDNASLNGAVIADSKLYCTLFPCNNCTIRIIQNKISEIIVPSPDLNKADRKYDISLEMLAEAEVKIKYYKIL